MSVKLMYGGAIMDYQINLKIFLEASSLGRVRKLEVRGGVAQIENIHKIILED